MIRIEPEPWQVMVAHARAAFPKECCGVMIGREDDNGRLVTIALPCRNAYEGDQKDRFALDPRDLIAAERKAREAKQDVLGFFHSHPNEASYFSQTDLKNSAPGYSNIVISIRDGEFNEAKSFIADLEQTQATQEELSF